MTFEEIGAALIARFGPDTVHQDAEALSPAILVPPQNLTDAALFLRETEGLELDYLCNLTAVDYPPDRMQMVYHLFSTTFLHALTLKVDLPREAPRVSTVSSVWPAANWHEREMYDLLGVDFEGHPDQRRILMPELWEGHPLRKDWEEPTHYRGMPTTRTFSNELYTERDDELRRFLPLRALLVHDEDGSSAVDVGAVVARRLALGDIVTEFRPVSQADPSQLSDYDLLIFGVNAPGLLVASTVSPVGTFVDLLTNLNGMPCAIYLTYRGHPAKAIRTLDAKVRQKNGRILATGAVVRGRTEIDPNDLAARILDQVRMGNLPRREAPVEKPEMTASPAEQAADAS